MSVQALGTVPIGRALTRKGAQIGDDIWVGDLVGQAALALAALQSKLTLTDADWTAVNLPCYVLHPKSIWD